MMDKEKLIINNFAGIKHLEFELNKINIIIGPQASGKSIIAKLFFYFKTFFKEIETGIEDDYSKKEIDKNLINRFTTFFPKESWPKDEFSIEYSINETHIRIAKKHNSLELNYSNNIKTIIIKARNILKKEKQNIHSNLGFSVYFKKKYYELIKKNISNISTYTQFFIPAGRSFFSNIKSNIFSFLSTNKSIDPFLIEFGSFYQLSKGISESNIIKRNANFERIISRILNSYYVREKEKDYLIHNDNRKVNLANASSGQQEILPLLLILKTSPSVLSFGNGITLYIEEPEAHLFPNAQKNIIKLLARVFNSKANNFQFIITTHSPYILSSFNNLLYAGQIAQKRPDSKEVFKIVPKEEIIFPSALSAYSLNLKGQKQNLIDAETGLISNNLLDDVSNEISIEFGKLLDIEHEN